MAGNETVTVREAAQVLGLSECSVRIWVEAGMLPIGHYVKRKGGRRGLIRKDGGQRPYNDAPT